MEQFRLLKDRLVKYVMVLLLIAPFGSVGAENLSHALWLQMKPNKSMAKVVIKGSKTPTTTIAKTELQKYYSGSKKIVLTTNATVPNKEIQVLKAKGSFDSFEIVDDGKIITISGTTDRALLYGTYELLRNQTLGKSLTVTQTPTYAVRCLNHWDNPNGTMERGFSGRSIFWSKGSSESLAPLWRDYARANASIGVNATVLDNVNANKVILTTDTLRKIAQIANVLRPYGIRVYLAVNFATPKALGELETADPLVPEVREWWSRKVDEIYSLIPDFGGFLVKANSEGEPGPMDYGRTHVDGANMLAEALSPHGGLVMWRAFVYAAKGGDRASQAYNEFVPYDGQFNDNVIIQIKNGPIDFQPREPLSPLFYALHKTRIMPEVQITQEYTGHNVHTCFLAPMWKESVFNSSEKNNNLKIASSFDAVAGVANIGDDADWCGSDMAQANWYVFGRLAWNANLSSRQIAEEWLSQTFTTKEEFVKPVTNLLLRSHEAVVSYMMPMGLHHIFAGGHHYGPEPWCNPRGWREDWIPRFYHRADSIGLGFNRSTFVEPCVKDSLGSRNVLQYPEPLSSQYNNLATCPENLILWFHHVDWNYKMKNGKSMWENLCAKYDEGVKEAAEFVNIWKSVKFYIDSERYERQLVKFERQAADAWWWRDGCLLYFQQFSRKDLPVGAPAPRHTLDNLMRYRLNIDNYTAPPLNKLPN